MQDSISRIHALFSVIVNRGLKMLNETSKKWDMLHTEAKMHTIQFTSMLNKPRFISIRYKNHFQTIWRRLRCMSKHRNLILRCICFMMQLPLFPPTTIEFSVVFWLEFRK
jgi:hypothetical protein